MEAEIVESFGQFVDQIEIDILGNVLSFFLLTVVRVYKLLCFVEVLLVGVIEDVTGKDRYLLG